MICSIHRLKCNEICLQKQCKSQWEVCNKCNHHSHHQTTLSVDLFKRISEIVKQQNFFENDLKQQLLYTLNSEIDRTLSIIKVFIQQNVADKIKNTIRHGKLGPQPQVQLAINEYERDGYFKQKYRDKLLYYEFNMQFEKEIQKQIRDRQMYHIQTVFFNLLANIKDTIINSDKSVNERQFRDSTNKTRSFSGKSLNSTVSNSSVYGRKRKRSLGTKHSVFKEAANATISKQFTKIKKTPHHQFTQQQTQIIDKGQKMLKILEHKLAARFDLQRVKIQQPNNIKPEIKKDNYNNNQISKNTTTIPNQYTQQSQTKPKLQFDDFTQNIPQKVTKNRKQPQKHFTKQPTNEQLRQPQKQQIKQQFKQQITYHQLKQPETRPVKQITSHQNKQNKQNRRTVQRSSNKTSQVSRIDDRNRSTNLKKGAKIQKRVQIVHNKQNQQFEQSIKLQSKKTIPPKTIQQIQTRLKIVPQMNGFLKQNLSELQQIWQDSNNNCWKMYFELKQQLSVKQPRYQQEYKQTASLTYCKSDIVEQLQFNIKSTNIKTISRPRNHLILQYLVKYSSQLLILFQGVNVKATKFSAQQHMDTLSNLSDGDVKGAYAYMNSILVKLKELI